MANIATYLNNIKNAVFGKEVRGSIHDGIKAMNEEVESTTSRQKVLDSTFEQLIINAGSSNAEVVAARVDESGKSHDTLGKRLNSVDTQIKEKANENIWGYNQIIRDFSFPKEFNFSSLPNLKVKGNGECIHYLDVSNYEIKGKTYYVDIKTGLGDNDGLTPETPLSNIQVAIDKGDADTIIVGSGWYEHNHGYANTGILINSSKKTVSIKAKGDGDVYISANSYNLSFSLEGDYTNVYSASRSGVGRVIDIKYKDNDGEFLELTKVSSIAEVENRANSYFTDNVKVYIHTKDNRSPDNNIKCLFNTIYPLQFHKDLYLEGIKIIGGKSPLKGGSGAKLYAKDCEYKFSTLENGITINSSLAILQNCIANNNYLDGFNYNGGNVIEIGCKGFRNGVIGIELVDTQNGSTQHNGGKIIRIGCEYGENKGSNVGDNHINTQSVNINVIAHNSRSENEQYNSNFTAHPNSEIWLYNCVSYGSKKDLLIQDKAKMHINNKNILDGIISNEGDGALNAI